MADSNNPGQFGNRDDTIEQAKKGGEKSSSEQDMSKLGKKGAEAQPRSAKVEGGKHGGSTSRRS